jgi:uncharacterized MnhB-related membrane protein
MLLLALVILLAICGLQVMHARQLLTSALWLAGSSAAVAAMLYLLGAPQVAVIELSVGAGLVTILFVFAIAIAGESTFDPASVIPKSLAWLVIGVTSLLLGLFVLTPPATQPARVEFPLSGMLWSGRTIDMLLQVVLIFTGVLGVLGFLMDSPRRKRKQAAAGDAGTQQASPADIVIEAQQPPTENHAAPAPAPAGEEVHA